MTLDNTFEDEIIDIITEVNVSVITPNKAYRKLKSLIKKERISDTKIGMLRQWLNEDRIKDAKRFVTNKDIKDWLK